MLLNLEWPIVLSLLSQSENCFVRLQSKLFQYVSVFNNTIECNVFMGFFAVLCVSALSRR